MAVWGEGHIFEGGAHPGKGSYLGKYGTSICSTKCIEFGPSIDPCIIHVMANCINVKFAHMWKIQDPKDW